MIPKIKTWVLAVTGTPVIFILGLLIQPIKAEPPSWPPAQPIPRLETGMHTAPVWRLSVDSEERFLVTASKDKTVRIWDLTGGDLKLLQILRGPLGDDPFEGQLFCAAISPNGAEVAAAGYTGGKNLHNFAIYIFDRESGRITHCIRDLPTEISHLAFSPDGRFLAVTLVGAQGLRVYRSHDWSEFYRDKDYTYDSYWADFGPQNRLVTTSYDGYLRLYEPQEGKFKLIHKVPARQGFKPATARFSPDGSLLAVGFVDSSQVLVLSGETLSPRYEPNISPQKKGHLARVAWSHDGKLLYAGGGYIDGGIHPIGCWPQKETGPANWLPASFDSIMDLYPLKNGNLIFAAADPAIGILDPAGRQLHIKLPNIPDFRNKLKEFRISQDAGVIEFGFALQKAGLKQEYHQARLDIKTRQFILDPPGKSGEPRLTAPDTSGFNESDWKNAKPRFRGIYDPLIKSYCVARLPKGRGFMLGTDWYILFYDERGEPQFSPGKNYEPKGRVIRLPSSAQCLNVSGDGKFVVAALGDGSLRWYSLDDMKEILAFFRHRDGRWVMWSPEGFFTCSTDGEKMFGYHLNQGPDKTPQFVTSDQFYDQFYRCDLVSWHLGGRLNKEVNTALQQGDIRQVLTHGLPPVLALPGDSEVHQKEKEFPVEVKITDQGGGIGRLVYRINDVTLKTRSVVGIVLPGRRDTSVSANLPLVAGKNVITVTAYNSRGQVESQPVSKTVYVEEPTERPCLYGLIVGINSYRSSPLKYAADDAKALKDELEKRSPGLFHKITLKLLQNNDASRKAIQNAFQELAPQVKPKDVFFLFLAGHGLNLDGRYCFLTCDPASAGREVYLNQEELQTLLAQVPAQKSLILLDTCYAGAFTDIISQKDLQKTGLDRLNRATGRAIISAVGVMQVALEGYQGHGVFTHALLRGLQGDADRVYGNDDGDIDIQELGRSIESLVPQISRKLGAEQTPYTSDLRGVKFNIARIVK